MNKQQHAPQANAATVTGQHARDFIPRKPARVVRFEPGSTWMLGSIPVIICKQRSTQEVVVQHAGSDRIETVSIAALTPITPLRPGQERVAQRPLDQHSPQTWTRALQEEAAFRSLLASGYPSRADRTKIAKELGMTERHLRRKLGEFQLLQTTAAVLPKKPGLQTGQTLLNPRVEALIREQLTEALKTSPDIAVDDLHLLIHAAAKAMGLRPPGRATIGRRLRIERECLENLPPSIAKELAYRKRPVQGPHLAEGPLHIVELDHTVVDAHLVEPRYGLPIGRPVLSLMIDRFTRVILGMLLSLEAPSRLSVALCMHHAAMPKDAWLRSLGLGQACWPGFGLMHELYTDNGSEFHTTSLHRSCELYGIRIAFRPPGHPAAGGIIERAIGTFMTKVRLLPGSSYSKLLKETPPKAHRRATMTLAELAEYVARQVSIYHKNRHGTLGMPPLTAWERAWQVNGVVGSPRIPDDGQNFLLSFLPGVPRVVTPEGIQLLTLHYQCNALREAIRPGHQRMVRFDPRDLSQVYVEFDDRHLVVPLARPGMPMMSLWEWHHIHKHDIEAGRTRDPEVLAAELAANRRLIETTAKSSPRLRDARRLARQDSWPAAQQPARAERFVIASPLPKAPGGCRVDGE